MDHLGDIEIPREVSPGVSEDAVEVVSDKLRRNPGVEMKAVRSHYVAYNYELSSQTCNLRRRRDNTTIGCYERYCGGRGSQGGLNNVGG